MTIVYTSNTGFTQQYAQMLGEKTGYPVYPLEGALRELPAGSEIFYLGWVMASHITGLDKATRRFRVVAACVVGMSLPSPSVEHNLAKSNYLPSGVLFYLPGGYAPEKLKGMKKLMLGMVVKGMRQRLAAKPNRTQADFAQLELAKHGGSLVAEENLMGILQWLEGRVQ